MYRLDTVTRRVFVPMTISFDGYRVLRFLAHGEGGTESGSYRGDRKGQGPPDAYRSDPRHRMTTGSAAIVFDAEPLSPTLYRTYVIYEYLIFSGGPRSRPPFEDSQVRSAGSGRVGHRNNNCTGVIGMSRSPVGGDLQGYSTTTHAAIPREPTGRSCGRFCVDSPGKRRSATTRRTRTSGGVRRRAGPSRPSPRVPGRHCGRRLQLVTTGPRETPRARLPRRITDVRS